MNTDNWHILALAAAIAVVASGCVEVGLPASGDRTHAPLWPIFNMHNDPAIEDQQSQEAVSPPTPEGMRYPPAKTVARGHRTTEETADDEGAETLENPVPVTRDTLEYGRLSYRKMCAPCHGSQGLGNGLVADAFGRYDVEVPALANKRVQKYSDGRIYRTISHGYGNMWSYKSQLRPMERWAVVNYVRALQRARYPEPWDRKAVPTPDDSK